MKQRMAIMSKLRQMYLLLPLLLIATIPSTANAAPVCAIDPAEMPKSWMVQTDVVKDISQKQWSESESMDAEESVKSGLSEIIKHLDQKPAAVVELWDDSIESVLNISNGKLKENEIVSIAGEAARKHLDILISHNDQPTLSGNKCADVARLLPLSIFTHQLLPNNDSRTIKATERVNIAIDDCDGLPDLFELYDGKLPPTEKSELEDLYGLIIWSLWLVEAQVYPTIALPDEAEEFPEYLWNLFRKYRFKNADEFEDGAEDEDFLETAEIVTHLALIPSGSSRYPLQVQDLPDLHRFLRENFYTIVGSLDLDMLASFVDSLRQYGCTPENDLHVRDGTRTLLKYFHQSGDRWSNYKNPDDGVLALSDYDIIHKAWTGAMGVKDRSPGEPSEGNYGGIVRDWLPLTE